MDMVKLAGCAVVACVLIIVVRQYRPDMAVAAGLAAGAVLLGAILVDAVPLIREIIDLTDGSGLSSQGLSCVVKSFGICVIAQLSGDVCRDAGQISLASKIELGCAVAVLAVTLPLLTEVLRLAVGLIGG